ncbi:MAG: pyrroline-5-carboxylate reductase [Armatimonadetes bacterium]|nr:pyrroline-5-carboxylate reductase [Armatimonadota bacterium]
MSGQSETESRPYRFGVIGTGVMGRALLAGCIQAGVVDPAQVIAYDAEPSVLAAVCGELGVAAGRDNAEVVSSADTVLVAVKPQQLAAALEPVRGAWQPGMLLISIAAGVSIRRLQSLTHPDLAVARVMPNILCLVGAAASGVAFSPQVTEAQQCYTLSLLDAVGIAVPVEERLLDAVTGLSGSGPAFVALVIEALADGGVAAGLPRQQALTLAAQTVMGAGKYVLERGEHPGLLKDRVASPSGTTIAGLKALEAGGLRAALIEAVVRATERSRELGQS